jgi:hypothetical protein
MVELTNAYAEQQREADKENAPPAEGTRASAADEPEPWAPTSVEEMRALIGCLIYMGIVCMDGTRDYWAETTRQAFVADAFPRDRFLELLRCLRVSAEGEEGGDRLQKLRELIGVLEAQLLAH